MFQLADGLTGHRIRSIGNMSNIWKITAHLRCTCIIVLSADCFGPYYSRMCLSVTSGGVEPMEERDRSAVLVSDAHNKNS